MTAPMLELLRDELQARAGDVRATPALYERVQKRIVRQRRRRGAAVTLAVAMLAAAVVVGPSLVRDGLSIADRPGSAADVDPALAVQPDTALFTTQEGALIAVDLHTGERTELSPPRGRASTVYDLSVANGSTVDDFVAVAYDDGAGPIGVVTWVRQDGGPVRTSFTDRREMPGHSNRGFRTISPDGRWFAYHLVVEELDEAGEMRTAVGFVPIDPQTGELRLDEQVRNTSLEAGPRGWFGEVATVGGRSLVVHSEGRDGGVDASVLERTADGFEVVGSTTVEIPTRLQPRSQDSWHPYVAFSGISSDPLTDGRFHLRRPETVVEAGEMLRPEELVVAYVGPHSAAELQFPTSISLGNLSVDAVGGALLVTSDHADLASDEVELDPSVDGVVWVVRLVADEDGDLSLVVEGPVVRGVVSGALLDPR